MNVIVVDASALGALVFGEPEADSVAEMLSGGSLMAPHLLWYELASVYLKKISRYPAQSDELSVAFQMAGQLKISLAAVDHTAVVSLALRTNLTTYDASYLWIAIESGGQLVTLDKQLKEAASAI